MSPIKPRALIVAAVLASGLPLLTACQHASMASANRESPGEYVDDATITAKVKAALAKDPDVKAYQVSVETYRGVVQLSGFVDSDTNIRRAGELARQIAGVRSVKNDIRVKPAG